MYLDRGSVRVRARARVRVRVRVRVALMPLLEQSDQLGERHDAAHLVG